MADAWANSRDAPLVQSGCAVDDQEMAEFLERLSYAHLGQCPDHGFFSLG
jgi:hypothetical protein